MFDPNAFLCSGFFATGFGDVNPELETKLSSFETFLFVVCAPGYHF